MDYLCAKFGDFSFSRFGLTCGQTDRQTESDRENHRITEADDRYTHSSTVGVSNCNAEAAAADNVCLVQSVLQEATVRTVSRAVIVVTAPNVTQSLESVSAHLAGKETPATNVCYFTLSFSH